MAAAGGGGVPVACAACRYQRRRCGERCPLAPYFPRDRPRVFRNAHRLFGVSNILKTLDRAGDDPGRRHEAMQCVVYESQAWDLYPSAGCVPIIVGLQNRIQQAEHELRRVHADLEAYRRHQPMVVASTQLPELQDDMTMNYFADGMNGGYDAMPRESSTDSSVMRNAPAKMKDNNGFDHQGGVKGLMAQW